MVLGEVIAIAFGSECVTSHVVAEIGTLEARQDELLDELRLL